MHSDEHSARLEEVLQSIEETGTYELTLQELEFGAKTAWRNAPRCLNRIIWNTLHVIKIHYNAFMIIVLVTMQV